MSICIEIVDFVVCHFHGELFLILNNVKAEPSKKYWRCSWFRRKGLGCMAKAVTHGDWIVKKSCIHNHPLEMPGIFE